jgi:citrate synthase
VLATVCCWRDRRCSSRASAGVRQWSVARVDIEGLVGTVPYEQVWGLLVDGHFKPGLPPAEPHALTVRSGDHRVDVQSALAMLAPEWGFGQLIDITDEEARDNLARASVMALSFVAQSARGPGQPPVPQAETSDARSHGLRPPD